MHILKTTAAALLSGLLVGTASVSAWSATATNRSAIAHAEVASSNNLVSSPLAYLRWLQAATADEKPESSNNCRAGHMYSEHDLVGDPESCIMQGISISGRSGISVGAVR